MSNIHPQALVNPHAELDKGVSVGPYAVIGPYVKIGKFTEIGAFTHISGYTEIGKECRIFSHAVVGSSPQDLKYKGKKSFLIIGEKNIIREFVTINPGTEEGSKTLIGSSNLIMAYSHIAHNCVIGDNNVLANLATLAGHVTIGNRVVIGGVVAIHQFCRVGDFAIVGGCSKVVQDIPPFSLCDGHPASVKGLNLIGLKRAKFSKDKIVVLRKAFKILFFEGHSFDYAKDIINKTLPSFSELEYLISFISASKRGISR